MQKRVISYSFFSADCDPNTRSHYDPHSDRRDRYWYNLPAVIAANSHLYPDFVTRIYVHENMFNESLGDLLLHLSTCPGVEIVKKSTVSLNKLPMVWRMLPLWDNDVEIFLARDIDSIPNVQEVVASKAFIAAEFPCQGIRTHPDHRDENCILLGGLSGYKPQMVRNLLPLDFSFDEMIHLGLQIDPEWKWGTDLHLIKRIFLERDPQFVRYILDTPLRGEWGLPENRTSFARSTLPESSYQQVDMSYAPIGLLELCEKLTKWGGQPIDARPELDRILSFDNPTCAHLRAVFAAGRHLKAFYWQSETPQVDTQIIELDNTQIRPSQTIVTDKVSEKPPMIFNNSASASVAAPLRYESPLELPVILITYNRPNHTRQVLEGLRTIGASNLVIYSDGPASESVRPGVESTRALFSEIDWTVPTVIERTQNYGLAKSICLAVDQVFATEDFVILLEDDCVPGIHFLTYMFECYRRYRENHLIYGISGHTVAHHPAILHQSPYDVYFTPRIGSWGWGTWKDRWIQREADLVALVRECLDSKLNFSQGGSDIPLAVENLLRGTLKDVWTLNWVLSVYRKNGFYVYPTHSHIDNIGTDGSGVHCNPTDIFKTPMAKAAPTRFAKDVVLDLNFYMSHRHYFDVPNGESPLVAFAQLNTRLQDMSDDAAITGPRKCTQEGMIQ